MLSLAGGLHRISIPTVTVGAENSTRDSRSQQGLGFITAHTKFKGNSARANAPMSLRLSQQPGVALSIVLVRPNNLDVR